jgi:hypothetical protein
MATIRRATVAVVFSTFAPNRTKSSTISGGSAVIAMETMTRRSCESDSLIDIGGGSAVKCRRPHLERDCLPGCRSVTTGRPGPLPGRGFF